MAPTQLTTRTVPLKQQLVGFERVHLAAGSSTKVSFALTAEAFNLVDPQTGNVVSTPGEYSIVVSDGTVSPFSFPVTLTGSEVVVQHFPTV